MIKFCVYNKTFACQCVLLQILFLWQPSINALSSQIYVMAGDTEEISRFCVKSSTQEISVFITIYLPS